MCTAAEVEAIVAPVKIAVDHITESILEIKQALKELPCGHINEDLIRVKINLENLQSSQIKCETNVGEAFERIRGVEDGGNIKIKWIAMAIISCAISAGFAILIYKITRG